MIAAIESMPRELVSSICVAIRPPGAGQSLDEGAGAGEVVVRERHVQALEQGFIAATDALIEDDSLDHHGHAEEAETDEEPQDPLGADGRELEEFVRELHE
jgi:hypothetical protein